MNRIAPALPAILLLLLAMTGSAHAVQATAEDPAELRARTAMDRSDFTQVISILSETLTLRSPAETFLNLGIAYRHTRDLQKAKDILKEGEARFPKDPRI